MLLLVSAEAPAPALLPQEGQMELQSAGQDREVSLRQAPCHQPSMGHTPDPRLPAGVVLSGYSKPQSQAFTENKTKHVSP